MLNMLIILIRLKNMTLTGITKRNKNINRKTIAVSILFRHSRHELSREWLIYLIHSLNNLRCREAAED